MFLATLVLTNRFKATVLSYLHSQVPRDSVSFNKFTADLVLYFVQQVVFLFTSQFASLPLKFKCLNRVKVKNA